MSDHQVSSSREDAANDSFHLGNIQSLTSELNAYKKACLDLDARVSSLTSLLAHERETSGAKIRALELEIDKNICNKCSGSMKYGTFLKYDNSSKTMEDLMTKLLSALSSSSRESSQKIDNSLENIKTLEDRFGMEEKIDIFLKELECCFNNGKDKIQDLESCKIKTITSSPSKNIIYEGAFASSPVKWMDMNQIPDISEISLYEQNIAGFD